MDAERELIDVRTLATEIENANLWVWNTTVEAGLWVRLYSKNVSNQSFNSPDHRSLASSIL